MLAKMWRITGCFMFALSTPCWSQTYPEKPVRFIVPYTPGGGADILARDVARKLSESYGWNVIIDNRPGAGGNLGAEVAAKAPPDGYTFLFGHTGPLAVNPHLYKRMSYNPLKDFSPVILIGSTYNLLVVSPHLPTRSVKDLISLIKRYPNDMSYASAGVGSGAFLAAELFKNLTGLTILHIPYKGNAPALLDVLGGRIPLMFPSIVTAARHVQSGKLRALGITTIERSKSMPDVPTISETIPGYEASVWYGLVAPTQVSHPIVMALNSRIQQVLMPENVKKDMAEQGVVLQAGTADAFASFMKSEYEKWGKVVRASGMKID